MKNFASHFIRNNGIWVGGAVLVSKLSVFLTVIFTAWFLNKTELGMISQALNFLAFFTVLAGGGSYQGILRFGSIAEGDEKEKLKNYSFTFGLLFQVVMSFIFIAIAAVFYWSSQTVLLLICTLVIRFFGIFLLEQAKSEARADFNNKKFALLDIASSLALLLLTVAGLYFFGLYGYLLALCLSPFMVLFFHQFKILKHRDFFRSISEREFWNFSVTTAIATQVGEWIFLLDVFFISPLIGSSAVAEFRVSNTIPMNLVFIAYIILQTGYPELCRNYRNLSYQRKYLRDYFKVLLPIIIVLLAVSYLFADLIMKIFGSQYQDSSLFKILILVCASVMLIRAPFSYALAALGKPKWTLWVSLLMMALLSVSYYFIIPESGLKGVAWINVFGVTFSGILYASAYLYESKRIT